MYLVFVNLQKQLAFQTTLKQWKPNKSFIVCESYILSVSFLQVKSRVIQT